MPPTTIQIAIIGLTRQSASMALALKKSTQTDHKLIMIGYDKDTDKIKQARTVGAIDQDGKRLESAVENANIVLLDMPYHQVQPTLEIIGAILQPGTVILDLAPLKATSIAWAKQYLRTTNGKPEVYLVGVTPLLNPDYLEVIDQGVEAATADLFKNGQLILTPDAACPEEAVQLAVEIATLIGVKAHFHDPSEHDGFVAAMDLLPLMTQWGIFNTVSRLGIWDDLQHVSNPRFAQAVAQLSRTHPEAMAAYLAANRANMVRFMDELIQQLQELNELARTADPLVFGEAFQEVTEKHETWLNHRQQNRWKGEDDAPKIESTGFLGLGMLRFGKRDSKR